MRSITCRKILTDPEMHSKLKQSHSENPYYRHYFGVWYQESRDVGNIHYLSYRDNMILELGMAGNMRNLALFTDIPPVTFLHCRLLDIFRHLACHAYPHVG